MVDDFTYDFLLQVCREAEGKQVKAKEKRLVINTVKNVVWKNDVSSSGILCMPQLWCMQR